MQSIQELLKYSLQQKKKQQSNGYTQQTDETLSCDEEFDYWNWYFSPGNSIREWNEAHGVELGRNPTNNMPTFSADRDTLFADIRNTQTYPEYFNERTIDRFILEIYSYGQNRDAARSALEKTKKYIDGYERVIKEYGGTGLYYYSHERGSGKTFLSTILGNELTQKGHRVRWYSMPNLLQEIKSGFDRESSTSSSEVINRCRDCEILILDDIGVEKQSAWVNETVYSILDRRLGTCRPTIFTSNHRPEELSYDERIIDRITRMTEPIHMPEESVRKKLNQRNKLSDFLGN